MLCFCFFLHHAEKRLNSAIYRFLTRNGIDRYDPARFLDYKLEVLQMLLYCLPKFEPAQETEFLKYAKHYIQNGLLFCRMMVEAGSFASLAEYRHVRQIGAIYNNSAKTAQKSFPSLPSKADIRFPSSAQPSQCDVSCWHLLSISISIIMDENVWNKMKDTGA